MNLKLAIFILLLLVFCAFSQEIAEIEAEETGEISETAEVELDTTEIDISFEDIIEEISSKRVFAYITITPRIGNDEIQNNYADFLRQRADLLLPAIRRQAEDAHFRPIWYQPSVATGVSFNLETGIMLKIDERTNVNFGVGYSFDRMRAVYAIESSRDSVQVLRATSSLINNIASITLGGSRTFDTEYFSIEGVDAAGIYGGAMFLISRYFERDTIITTEQFEENFVSARRKNTDGIGAAGRVGLFARQRIGERSFFEYSIGYIIRVTSGFDEFWDRGWNEWETPRIAQRILSISNGLELSFSLIF
ncbi:MAG: hypothetical protein FWE23_09320 [Chitinivibrionia bacterium]|nr:hypothetical protein [Chitinivibrionia bacterium]